MSMLAGNVDTVFTSPLIEEFTLIVASWVIGARWREIRRFVLEFSNIFCNSTVSKLQKMYRKIDATMSVNSSIETGLPFPHGRASLASSQPFAAQR